MATTTSYGLYRTRISTASEAVHIPRTVPTVWGTAADGPLDQTQLDDHEANGYTILHKVLTSNKIRDFQQELAELSENPALADDPRIIRERGTAIVRSVFDVVNLRDSFARLARDPRILDVARQLLGSDVYLHQTRVNAMPGFKGKGFYWHSDFETWYAEDGMPSPRAVSCSISLTENFPFNGSLMVVPGSHQTFVPCIGQTPVDNHQSSLVQQMIGVPRHEDIATLVAAHGVSQFTGPAGSALWFDSNIMHGSNDNITPYPRSNIFLVFNSVDNTCVEPFAAPNRRPEYIASRDFTPLSR